MRYFLAPAIAIYILILRLTCRVVVHVDGENLSDASALQDKNQRYIFALWHGRLLLGAPVWLKLKRFGAKVTMLSSSHKDGRLIAAACKLLGFWVVFGSSTRGGSEALRGLVGAAKSGSHLFLTPDGPKGPKHVAKGGVIAAARLTGLPIVPIGLSAHGKALKSWDGFLAIRPFTKIHVVLGAPMVVAKDKATAAESLLALEQRLIELERAADGYA